MENEEALAQKICKRADREYNDFINEMKAHDAGYVVGHAYEIVIMSDLRMIFEEDDLSLPALKELDKVGKPLASIYEEWLRNDGGHMEQLRGTIDSFIEARLRDAAEKLFADSAVPRYINDFKAAKEADELHLYRANRKRDIECIRYYDRADHIQYIDVPGATSEVLRFVQTDMPDKYSVTISSADGTATPPSLTVVGTVTFSTLFNQYGFDDVTFDIKVRATNYGVG